MTGSENFNSLHWRFFGSRPVLALFFGDDPQVAAAESSLGGVQLQEVVSLTDRQPNARTVLVWRELQPTPRAVFDESELRTLFHDNLDRSAGWFLGTVGTADDVQVRFDILLRRLRTISKHGVVTMSMHNSRSILYQLQAGSRHTILVFEHLDTLGFDRYIE